MFEVFAMLTGMLFFEDNKDFFRQVKIERDLGYEWHKIERTPAGTFQYEIPAIDEDGNGWIHFQLQEPKQK